jgi:hypothetical protein
MLFVGDDWAEDHHDIELVDDTGRRLAKARLPEGIEGISRLHALLADHLPEEWADPDTAPSAGRWWSGSRPTGARGWPRWSRPAAKSMRSTRCPLPATANATPPPGRSRAIPHPPRIHGWPGLSCSPAGYFCGSFSQWWVLFSVVGGGGQGRAARPRQRRIPASYRRRPVSSRSDDGPVLAQGDPDTTRPAGQSPPKLASRCVDSQFGPRIHGPAPA